jgi:hypothetical protein
VLNVANLISPTRFNAVIMLVLLKTDLPINVKEHLPVNSDMAQMYVLTQESYQYNNIVTL